jgi:uncharacterized protein YecT (DUF1311 family)
LLQLQSQSSRPRDEHERRAQRERACCFGSRTALEARASVIGGAQAACYTSVMRTFFATLVSALVVAASAAHADPPRATAGDRAAVEACLALVRQNAETEAQKPVEDEAPGPAGRLAGAAKDAATQSESCIGAVTIPCQQQPGGSSTAGMIECNHREWAVWDERLNRAYSQSLKGAEPKLATALRETQRAWLQWREKSCKLPAIDNEGGSIVGPLYTGCMLYATARQALSLQHRE